MKLKKIILAICLFTFGVSLCACNKKASKLDEPSNLKVINKVLSWSEVANTTGYTIYISDDNIVTEKTTSYSLSLLLPGNYNLKVKAIGDGKKYLDSIWSANLPYEVKVESKDYILIFDSNKPSTAEGNITGTMVNQLLKYDENQNLNVNSFALEGWTFKRWNTKADGTGTTYENGEVVYNLTEEKTIILYAIWEKDSPNEKNVKFYGPDNTIIKQVNVEVGNKVQRPIEIETQPYKFFINWYTESNFSIIYNFDLLITTDLNIYGKWETNDQGHYAYVGTYYETIDFTNFTKTEESELLILLKQQAPRSYSSGNWAPCEDSARDPNNNNNVILIYNSASEPYSTHTWNKEHVWPQALMPSSIAGDQQNLFPCNPTINSNRGNLAFTDSSGTHKKVGSKYYPGDNWRGEVARTLMYMAFRYSDSIKLSTLIDPATALKWHQEDPVTKWEMDRNNILFKENYQNNRNPFVDHPELANIIYAS